MSSKKILIINTGGTISSIKTTQGYTPAPHFLSKVLDVVPALKHADMPQYDIKEYHPLLDSSNMTLHDWNKIAHDIAVHYAQYDGFVILHGTDTMAYTASALSFMLENLSKPIIFTGSQIPLSEARNDAGDNLITSLWIAANMRLPEVCIYFNQVLLRGNRTRKISSEQFAAFNAPNFPPLATSGIHIETQNHLILPMPTKPFHLQQVAPQFIANFKLFPGFSTEVFEYILNQPLKAFILETYGAGNAPNQDKKFLDLLTEACKRNIVIVNCTQCLHGRVEMNQYATGYTLKQAGILNGYDMTPEATHCKLLYLFSKYESIATIKSMMETNLRGELSNERIYNGNR